jgi:hypothetical protein
MVSLQLRLGSNDHGTLVICLRTRHPINCRWNDTASVGGKRVSLQCRGPRLTALGVRANGLAERVETSSFDEARSLGDFLQMTSASRVVDLWSADRPVRATLKHSDTFGCPSQLHLQEAFADVIVVVKGFLPDALAGFSSQSSVSKKHTVMFYRIGAYIAPALHKTNALTRQCT